MPVFHQGEVITSRQNRRIVELCKLDDRRARDRARLFRFDGIKLLFEALTRGVSLDAVYLRVGSEERVAARLEELGCSLYALDCPIFGVEDDLFEKISQENAPEGVISVAKYLDKRHKMCKIYNRDGNLAAPTVADGPILLLESVRDPLNVGAVIRSAAALGVSELILSADCADIYHSRAVRAAMGPLFSLTITRVEDMAASVAVLRDAGHIVLAAALDDTAVSLGSPELTALLGREGSTFALAPCAVIGNEGHGLSPAVIAACDRSVYIPMQAGTESLNAGVAAALLMWELRAR